MTPALSDHGLQNDVPEVAILPLSPALLPSCVALAQQAPDPWSEAGLAGALEHRCRHVFVAVQKDDPGEPGTPMGFACFYLSQDGCDLEQLVVDEALRRQGMARRLLEKGLRHMAALGAARCLLEVRTQNRPAIALYEALGFTVLARRPGMYSHPADDGLLMAKELGSQKDTK